MCSLIEFILYTVFVLDVPFVFQVEVDNYENRDHEIPYLTKNRQGMIMYSLQNILVHMIHIEFLYVSFRLRFMHKGIKWYGWTPEQAEDEWDKAVRDPNVKRRKDAYGELTIAKLQTAVHHVGIRVGNKRSIAETKKFNAEDQEAITDAKESSSLNIVLHVCKLFCFFKSYESHITIYILIWDLLVFRCTTL